LHLSNSAHEIAGTCDAQPPTCRLPTILLVEDEAFVRQVAYEILCSAGYWVLLASNAAEAVLAFRDHRQEVQLLLTDVVLPDRNGCELAHELVGLGSSFKAIFVSGYPENSVSRTGLKQPGWSYLPKPFSAASLLQRVNEALNM
jgi:two-component system cell cycle sensor histidine kinase/response regulator CckA